ncbi:hypothetical protein B0J15DRAFT_539329 [Fusarium solani]|uniref:Zn(2)-C6 fungal-type domain-containing protein n=1 Tax=Fusarium solani TaxID=169388 RepID=A0A9P9JTZ4_FUSSL|nr:uncharacterized protein B0J15DRAFT_539329 [Fusarium solani]KAH7232110.1 hypothetical protein B0J15DRAFT_539329 [Fusarium solani]
METSSTGRKRTSVRRANVTACQRCKSRKQRCDQNIPACSSCARAGVPCVSVDADGRSAPRSYIKSLEDRVAQLELALRSHGVETESVSDAQTPQEPGTAIEAPSEQHQVTGGLTLLNLLVPDPGHIQDGAAAGYHGLLENITVPTVVNFPPKPTALQLAATYFEHSNFFSPILDEGRFRATVESLYDAESGPSQGTLNERFRLLMVLAIAIRLLNRTDAAVPTTGSESFFASAIHVFTERPHAIWKGDLEHLQNLLLIRGLPYGDETPITQTQTNKRRRVFWSTYILETNLCVVLNRPRSIPDEAIFTPLPSTSGPEASTPLANHCIIFRQAEYEIFHTLNYKPRIHDPLFDFHQWKIGMRDRLVEWHQTVPPLDATSKLAPQNFFDGALYMTLVYLFSPSSHFPSTPEAELRDLAQYASRSIELYRAGFKEGQLRFYWRTIPNLFRSGAALVHCIKTLRLNGAVFDANELEKRVTMCSTVLWGMAERYPPGASYRDRFEELAASMSEVSSPTNGIPSIISHEFLLAHDVIAPLDLDDTATLWTTTPPNLDPWIFDQS